MPPEPTKAKLKRRSSRKDLDEFRFDGTHARELELKRNRGEVSCAECRRLKIKCDKQIPCQSCQRRGCTALCPNGSLSTGQGTRFVIAATEHLHRRIAKLSTRVRLLEDALAALQAKHTSEPHPLLHADLVVGAEKGYGDEGVDVDMDGREDVGLSGTGAGGGGERIDGEGNGTEVIDTFGTLSISHHGVSRFFGPTGGSESLLLSNLDTPYYDLVSSSSSSPFLNSSSTPESRSSQSPPSSLRPTSASASIIASPNPTSDFSTLHPSLALFSSSFPFTPLGAPSSIHALILAHHLPTWSEAVGLCAVYFEQVAWLFRGVTRGQVVDDMLPGVYAMKGRDGDKGEKGEGNEETSGEKGDREARDGEIRDGDTEEAREGEGEYGGPHDIALVFMVFAIGALVGPQDSTTLPSTSPVNAASSSTSTTTGATTTKIPSGPAQAEHFYQIARAALTLQPVLEKPSIVTVQSLHLMSVYNAMSGSDMRSETSMEMTWSLITVAAHLSQTIGLHRDSERWGLTPKMVQRRRILFWDLFVADTWQSLNTGRPPTFSLPYVDCSFPSYEEMGPRTPEKKMDDEYELWQFKFAAEVVAEVTARTLTAEAPTYATIMELDRKVREFPLPESMTSPSNGSGAAGSGEEYVFSFQRCVLDHVRETILLYIHRSFFAQAIIDQPDNPLKSAYAPSFLASYRASSTILKTVIEHFNSWPESGSRFWTMWTFAFTAAVVFGTVVTRGPRSPLAKSAMRELEQACVLFSKASMYSVRAAKALPILTKLNEKAHYALQAAQSDPSGGNGLHWTVKQEDTEDELAIFAGHTRFVSGRKEGTGQSTPSTTTATVTVTGGTGSGAGLGVGTIAGTIAIGGATTATTMGQGAKNKIKAKKSSSAESEGLSKDGSFGASTGVFQAALGSVPLHTPQHQSLPPPLPPLGSSSYRGQNVQQGYNQPPPTSYGHGRAAESGGGAPIPISIPSHPYAHSGGSGSASPESNMDTSDSGGATAGPSGGVGGSRQWSYGSGGQHLMEHQHQQQHQQSYSYAPPELRIPPIVTPMRQHHHPQPPSQWGTTGPTTNDSDRAGGMPRIARMGGSASAAAAAGMYSGSYASHSHPLHHPNSSSESIELRSVPQEGDEVRRYASGYASGSGGHHQHNEPQHQHPPQHSHHPQHHQPQHYQQPQHVPQYQSMYSAFAPQQQQRPTNPDLADLGIASRDSRLDEKWSMFMTDSGILEPGFRTG